MITVANRIYVNAEYSEAFEQRFRERAGLVDQMPGFVSNQVLRPVNDGDPYVVFTVWDSRQDFLNWVRSDAFTKGHAQSGTLPKEAFSKRTCWRCTRSCRIRRAGFRGEKPGAVQDALDGDYVECAKAQGSRARERSRKLMRR